MQQLRIAKDGTGTTMDRDTCGWMMFSIFDALAIGAGYLLFAVLLYALGVAIEWLRERRRGNQKGKGNDGEDED